ncbi:hypothetical protein [Trinickia diaoshuihuensis]|jgi:hypothetical protein|uniref:hypothetical protein n=1 Tax=Trinickia diaoshuihuensis TaxID=2292265 RepID=UPI000E24E2BC|nr:hypothetical protein [Trinickia diaoshuihuensis]
MSSSVESAVRALEQRTYDEWPPALRALFDGSALSSKVGFTASLITSDAAGHLRTSLLGIGELYVPDSRTIAFALWPSSRAARSLAGSNDSGDVSRGHRRVQAALAFVHDGAFHQVQLAVEALPSEADAAGCGLALFVASIEAGEAQQVGYARLTCGITFELPNDVRERQAVLARWEKQIGALREAVNRRSASGG